MNEPVIYKRQDLDTAVQPTPDAALKAKRQKIMAVLKKLGAVKYDLVLPETHLLPTVIRRGEIIKGIVYGRYRQEQPTGVVIGRGALVTTNERLFLLDRKPLFVQLFEIEYGVVSAVTYSRVGFIGNVTIHTRMGKTIILRTFNQHCARGFVEGVESQIFKDSRAETGEEEV